MGSFTIKGAILPKLTYKFNLVSIKSIHFFSVKINKLILKFMWKINVHNIIKFIFEREQGDLSNLEAHCEAILSNFCFQGKKCTEK